MNQKPISHGIRIWAFHFQVAIPLVCFWIAMILLYFAVFRVAGLDLMPIEGLYERWGEFSFFEGQPMWAKMESGVCLAFAVLFTLVGLIEMVSYVFFNLANPLKVMPRISKNLGHYYYDEVAKEKSTSNLLYLKNSLFYGLAFVAFFVPMLCATGVVEFVNMNDIENNKEAFTGLLKSTGITLLCTTGLFLILDFLYILFMEIHPKQRTIFEVIFNFRKVSGRQ